MAKAENSLDAMQASEVNGLVPFLDKEELAYLLAHLEPILKNHDFGKIQTFIDLEQLQIAHYPSLFSKSRELPAILDLIQNSGLYDQLELDFLTLRSLITLAWPRPETSEQLQAMAQAERQLEVAMLHVARHIRTRHADKSAWLPYWARLAHFNLLRHLPKPLQGQFGPDGIPCILLRSRDINAHTFPLPTGRAIVLDYALEPFLKDMNTFLHSYFGSRDMAGPKRTRRAFAELLPRVLFFKGIGPAHRFPFVSILFGDTAVHTVKATSDAQISFLIAHEIGHVALGHPGIKAAFQVESTTCGKLTYFEFEHMYEYEADAFALDWLRSKVINSFRYHLHPTRTCGPKKLAGAAEKLTEALSDYAHFYTSVELLFIIIHFLEAFYHRLTQLVPELPVRALMTSHPAALERWRRLQQHCVYDIPLGSGFNEYATELLSNVLEYITTVSSESIGALIKEALADESEN